MCVCFLAWEGIFLFKWGSMLCVVCMRVNKEREAKSS